MIVNDLESIEIISFLFNKSIVHLLSIVRFSNSVRKHPDFVKILYAGFGEEKKKCQQKAFLPVGKSSFIMFENSS